MKHYISCVTLATCLLGCVQDPNMTVRDRWIAGIENYSIRPTYPLREDVYVGDLRLTTSSGNGVATQSRAFSSVDLSEPIADFLSNRMELPETGDTAQLLRIIARPSNSWTQEELDGGTTRLSQAAGTAGESIFAPSDSLPSRMRMAALPNISVVRFTGADLSASSFLRALGLSGQQDSTLEIALTGVESVEVDDVSASRALSVFWEELLNDQTQIHALCRSAAQLSSTDPEDVRLELVTRVFYTRGIRYTSQTNTGGALNIGVGVGAPIGIAGIDPLEPPAAPGDDQEVVDSTDSAENAAVPRPPIAGLLVDPTAAPSGVLRLAASNATGDVMVETFQRPMAFGVDSLAIQPFAAESPIACSPNLIASAADGPAATQPIISPADRTSALGDTPLPACQELVDQEVLIPEHVDAAVRNERCVVEE